MKRRDLVALCGALIAGPAMAGAENPSQKPKKKHHLAIKTTAPACGSQDVEKRHSLAMVLLLAEPTVRGAFIAANGDQSQVSKPLSDICSEVWSSFSEQYNNLYGDVDNAPIFEATFAQLHYVIRKFTPDSIYGGPGPCPAEGDLKTALLS